MTGMLCVLSSIVNLVNSLQHIAGILHSWQGLHSAYDFNSQLKSCMCFFFILFWWGFLFVCGFCFGLFVVVVLFVCCWGGGGIVKL